MTGESTLEQNFVNKLIQDKTPVSVFLKNGIKLTGIIIGADQDTLYLKNMIVQMVYKHAVSTVMGGN
jgi:host factor-I protein